MLDEFSNYYAEFLDSIYDCVDRIVLNAYFSLGHNAGGFRNWWRQLKGTDENLTNTQVMRFAGRMSRRLRSYAKAHEIPVIDCYYGDRKHKIAEEYIPQDADFVGVFLILVSRAPGVVWHIQRSKTGEISHIVKRKPLPHVNHYSFHIMDPDWGHITIKICAHPPFAAQIMLNGHEYVARQAKKEEIKFSKAGNCFTDIADARRLSLVADTLCSLNTIGRLRQVCERWIYTSCLCFALDMAEQERSGFRYDYSIYQIEYSRNLLFKRGGQMDQLFQGIIDRTRSHIDVRSLRTIFGNKRRPYYRKHKKEIHLEVVVEKPVYNLTVFKLHFGKLTAKLYTKGERVLRVEVIVHNARLFSCGRSLNNFPEMVKQLRNILHRFLNQLNCVDLSCITNSQIESWPATGQVGKTRVGGIDINNPRIIVVMEAVIELAMIPQGFGASQLAKKFRQKTGASENEYSARKASYDLKKLRSKALVCKIEKSRKYQATLQGLKSMTAWLALTQKVIKPILAGIEIEQPRLPHNQTTIDQHYQNLQTEMKKLFSTMGIAA
jgi:hypothetical protein